MAGTDTDWIAFPGGELEGPRPNVLCAKCLTRGETERRTLCFACYRAHFERQRAIETVLSRVVAPADDPTAGELPPRAARSPAVVRQFRPTRATGCEDPRYAAFAHRRRRAQIAARHALAPPTIDLERFPVSWRPFVRIALQS